MPPYASFTAGAQARRASDLEEAAPARRIEVLDVLRGVAICGILLMNIWKMGGVSEFPLTTFPARWNLEWVTWGIQALLVDGAMRGLFTLLFGASMLLMLRRAETDDVASPIDIWARRSLGLMALGLFQWLVLQWPGEILWDYGVAGLFLLAFRRASVRTLLTGAALILTALSLNTAYRSWQEVDQLHRAPAAVAAVAQGRPISADDRAAITAAAEDRAAVHPSAADRAERIRERTHLKSLLRWGEHFWAGENIGLSGWIEVAESVAFMMIGMALYRTGLMGADASAITCRRLMIVGYGGGLALRAILVTLAVRTGWDLSAPSASVAAWTLGYAVFEPARLLVTLGHLGLVMTLFRSGVLGQAVTLRAMGRMTLSLYCFQSLVTSLLFYGLGYVGAWGLPALWGVAALIWVASAVLARWWLARFAMGPMERALRILSRGEAPWVRRPDAISTATPALR